MAIITPEKLNLDAVIPQCLDNQFVPDDLLLSMVKTSQDFNSTGIKERRTRLAVIELRRSLLYAKQVVINRAFFVNTLAVFGNYDSRKGAQDFAELMNSGAIIPFVTGNDLLEKRDFEQHPDGAKALELLLPHTTHTHKVTLNKDKKAGPNQADPLGTHFTTLLAGLGKLKSDGVSLLLQQLGARMPVISARKLAFSTQFERNLQELAGMAQTKLISPPPQILSRNEIYQHFFCIPDSAGGKSVANGRFSKKFEEDSTLILLKQLVDTAYNFNLPDHLGCFSLTAPGMAGRTPMELMRAAASLSAPTHSVATKIGKEEERLLEAAARINARYLNKAIEVPLLNLEKLTIKDIHTIRENRNWISFIKAKEKLLAVRSADVLPGVFDEYVRRHRELHKAIFHMGTTSVLPERLARITHYIDSPLLKLAGAVADLAGLDTVSDITELLEALPKEAALEIGMNSVNEMRERLRSTMAFRSIHRLEVPTRNELSRLNQELHKLSSDACKRDNGEAEQSRP